MQRITSPNGNLDAVIYETNSGATTSFGYQVFVVPRGENRNGEPAAYLDAARRSSTASGANLRWTSANTLSIEFLEARSVALNHKDVPLEQSSVHLAFVAPISDPEAPPGGMLYNIRLKSKGGSSNATSTH